MKIMHARLAWASLLFVALCLVLLSIPLLARAGSPKMLATASGDTPADSASFYPPILFFNNQAAGTTSGIVAA